MAAQVTEDNKGNVVWSKSKFMRNKKKVSRKSIFDRRSIASGMTAETRPKEKSGLLTSILMRKSKKKSSGTSTVWNKTGHFNNLSLDDIEVNSGAESEKFEIQLNDFDPEIYRDEMLEASRHTTHSPPRQSAFLIQSGGIQKLKTNGGKMEEKSEQILRAPEITPMMPKFVKNESLRQTNLTTGSEFETDLSAVDPFEDDDELVHEDMEPVSMNSEIIDLRNLSFMSPPPEMKMCTRLRRASKEEQSQKVLDM